MSWQEGRVQVYTGDGKGKTTAAVGLAVRAAGAGLRVFFGQFVKGRPAHELHALRALGETIVVRQFGRAGFITGRPEAEDVRAAEAGWAEARSALTGGAYRVVVLDEAIVAVCLGLFSLDRLLALVRLRPSNVELVLTGRGAQPRLVAAADLVTEMRAVKHYHAAGVPARDGIEC